MTNDVRTRLAKLHLPAGRHACPLGGDAQDQQEVFGQIFFALGVAVMLMYLILVVQFGSFLDPLAILMSLPLSLIGVLLALAITRHTINIMSLIGVILLDGHRGEERHPAHRLREVGAREGRACRCARR